MFGQFLDFAKKFGCHVFRITLLEKVVFMVQKLLATLSVRLARVSSMVEQQVLVEIWGGRGHLQSGHDAKDTSNLVMMLGALLI